MESWLYNSRDYYYYYYYKLLAENPWNIFYFVTILAFLYFVYKKIVVPYNYVQTPGKMGSKKVEINALRRLRKVGEKLPPPFPNAWIPVIESSALGKGQVKEVHCLGTTLAVFRSQSGESFVLDAHCPHIGANMARGGTVLDDCLKCPFHGWTFSGKTGDCVGIPDLETIPKNAQVRKWRSVELNNLILVWNHAEGAEPTYEVPVVEDFAKGHFKVMARNEFHVTCHVQEILENGGDLAHLNTIHRNSLLGDMDDLADSKWNCLDVSSWSGEWKVTEKPQIALMELHHKVTMFNKISFASVTVMAHQVGPTLVMMDFIFPFTRVFMIQSVCPVGPLQQRVIHNLFCANIHKPIANIIMWAETKMYARDAAVWMHKTYLNDPLLVKTDKSIKAYRTWYRQFYSENSTSFEEAVNSNYQSVATVEW